MSVHTALYNQLLKAAKASKTLFYSEVAPTVGLDISDYSDRNKLASLLADISTHEYNNKRPLLSAIVITKDNNYPGNGFFELATDLGVQTDHDNLKFFAKECRNVFDYWQ